MNKFIEANQKGYTYIDNKAFYDNNLSPTDKNVYFILCSACYSNKIECTPSQNTIAKAINRSVRTVQRSLKRLVQYGYIKIKRRGSISNIYSIIGKKILQTVDKAVNKAKNAYKTYNNNYKKQERPNFNDYNQRDNYNYNNLEAMLLGNMEYNPDLLYQP